MAPQDNAEQPEENQENPLTSSLVEAHLSSLGRNPFTQAHVFTTATLCDLQLTDLVAIELFPLLHHVKCNRNALRSLGPLRNLRCLLTVDASENQLTQVLDYKVPECSHSDAWVEGSQWIGSMLRTADLSKNRIETIQDLHPKHEFLRELYLDHNQIKAITGISHLRFLRVLSLSHNQITSTRGLLRDDSTQTQLVALEKLILHHNQIATIEQLSSLPRLYLLDLNHNQISTLVSLEHCDALQELDLSYNQVDRMNELNHLIQLTHLSRLSLIHCPLSQRDVNEDALFYRPRVLRRLMQLSELDGEEVSAKEKIKAQVMHGREVEWRRATFTKFLPQLEFVDPLPPLEFDEDQELIELEQLIAHQTIESDFLQLSVAPDSESGGGPESSSL